MITSQINSEEGIAVIEPKGPLSEEDFDSLTLSVDHYLESHNTLRGLLIHMEHFPGWENLRGFVHHMEFVKEHHKQIEKVALVTDTKVASILPQLASHFISAEVKHFEYDREDAALAWLQS